MNAIKTTSPFTTSLTDDDLFNAQGTYVNRVVVKAVDWGIPPAAVAALVARRAEYEPLYHKAQDKNTRSNTDVVAHQRIRKLYETELRNFHNEWIAPSTSITVEDKLTLGGREKDISPTPLSDQIVLTTPPPIIEAKCTGPKTVRIDWYPTQAPGQSEALPQGIDGVNIWVAEGGIPSDESQWRFLAMDTNAPYIHNVANDTTVTLAYKAQWFDKRKRMGPFCNPVVVAVTM
jgi:hypothetical protein